MMNRSAEEIAMREAVATWNPVTGCAVVSPGGTNCYAMRLAGTRLRHLASREPDHATQGPAR